MSPGSGSGVAALLRDYRAFAGARLWVALVLMLLGAVAEGFGLLMIVPLASIAIGSDTRLLGPVADWGNLLTPSQRLGVALALFVGAMAARSALLYARDLLIARLQTGYVSSLRLRAAATLARRGWTFASRVGQAGMQSLLLNDVPRAGVAVSYVEQFAIAAVMLLVQLALAALLSPTLTAAALLILAGGLLLSGGWTRRGVKSGLAMIERFEESTGSGFRMHAGLKAALAQGTVEQFLNEYDSSLDAARDEVVRFTSDVTLARSLAFLASAVAAAILMFVGVQLLALALPVLIASLVLFARMSGPAQSLQQGLQNVAAFAPSFAAIEARVGKLQLPPVGSRPARPLDWRELRLENVRFTHAPELGVRGATLRLTRGEWLGISGPSGSGKTTLVDLVAGLLTPQEGSIRLDSSDLDDDTLESWRAGLAYVGQEGFVFDDSVRDNLLAEGADASEDELWSALELTGLGDRIRAFPNGLDEPVGDRGSALSGGERQRLAIARALLRKPSVLILDEATAALDAEAEAGLLHRLRNLERQPAVLIVAHRPSTLSHCDSVIAIQHGVVRECAEATTNVGQRGSGPVHVGGDSDRR